MVDKALDQLILESLGALVVARNKLDITDVQHFGGGITIDDRATTITRHAHGYDELHLFAECGTHGQRCTIEWQGYVKPRPGVGVLRLQNTTYMVDWLAQEIPDGCARLNRALKFVYPTNQVECISWHARFGLPDDLEWSSQQNHGDFDGFHYGTINNRDFDHGGQYPLQMIVKSKQPLGMPHSMCVGNLKTAKACCNGSGCAVCNPASPSPVQQFYSGTLGQPHTGGLIPKSNSVPVMLSPGTTPNYIGPGIAALKAMNSRPPMNPKSPKDVYEILDFLEREIDVKIGMLSGQNIFLHRVTLYDRENWEDKLRGELDLIRRRLGDKIGMIGDMRIVSLDEVDWPEGHPLTGSKPSTAVGRKFSVHAAYRPDYQAIKLTIMALVKA